MNRSHQKRFFVYGLKQRHGKCFRNVRFGQIHRRRWSLSPNFAAAASSGAAAARFYYLSIGLEAFAKRLDAVHARRLCDNVLANDIVPLVTSVRGNLAVPARDAFDEFVELLRNTAGVKKQQQQQQQGRARRRATADAEDAGNGGAGESVVSNEQIVEQQDHSDVANADNSLARSKRKRAAAAAAAPIARKLSLSQETEQRADADERAKKKARSVPTSTSKSSASSSSNGRRKLLRKSMGDASTSSASQFTLDSSQTATATNATTTTSTTASGGAAKSSVAAMEVGNESTPQRTRSQRASSRGSSQK